MKLWMILVVLLLGIFLIPELINKNKKPYEVIATVDKGPGNIAVGPTGRIVMTMHQMYNPEIHIVELLKDGTTRPYPTEAWARLPVNGSEIGTVAPLGIRIDREGTLWLMDNASNPPKLIAWSMNTEKLKHVYSMPSDTYTQGETFINDMAINLKDAKAYLADVMGKPSPAMIVLDLKTGKARRVLSEHESVLADKELTITLDDKQLSMKQGDSFVNPRIGLDPITIDPKEEWVYYGAMHGSSLYRIPVTALNDESLSAEALAAKVERYGDKPVCDGISIDNKGNVYVTDLNSYGIGVVRPDGTYKLLYQNKELFIWPDGMAAGPDGMMLVDVNQLNRTAVLNGGTDVSKPPFKIVKFKPLANVSVGR